MKLVVVTQWVLRLNAEETAALQTELATIQPREREKVMKIVTSWMEEGIQQGRREEALSLALRLLGRRVGGLDQTVEKQIRQLSLAELEDISEALLDFSQASDVIVWLQTHEV